MIDGAVCFTYATFATSDKALSAISALVAAIAIHASYLSSLTPKNAPDFGELTTNGTSRDPAGVGKSSEPLGPP